MSAVPRRVLAYVRVSSQEQGRHGTSLDGQQEAIRRQCAARNFPEPISFVEVESAGAEKIERRAELRRLLDMAERGDVVVVSAVDRWSRDIVFAVQSVRELVARGVGFHALTENLDASTPHGDSTLGIMAWVADGERKRIRERTVGRRKELRDQGRYVEGQLPLGYRRAPGNTLEIDKHEAHVVREIFRRCIAGQSLNQIAESIELDFPSEDRVWEKSLMHDVLKNRLYLGEMKDSRGVWLAVHPAIVNHATFARAKEALASRRNGGRPPGAEARTASWLLRGLARCAFCGARMGAAYSRNDRDYYVCGQRLRHNCENGYMRVEQVDVEVARMAFDRLVELREELARPAPKPAAPRGAQGADAKRERLTAQRNRVITAYTKGMIAESDLQSQLARIDHDLARLAMLVEDAARAAKAPDPEARRKALADVAELSRAWSALDVTARREAVDHLARTIRLRSGSLPEIEWRTADELAEDAQGGYTK
jgi:DNA invertase Pin-like site-specific DNA recombinase